jgi:hypothetical protein
MATTSERKSRLLGFPATRRSLELTQTIRTGSREGSLLEVIDRTVTPMGARRLSQWLASPLVAAAQIESRLGAVEELVRDSRLRNAIRESLSDVYDLERLLARVATGRCSPRDLQQVGRSLRQLPKLKAVLEARSATRLTQLKDRIGSIIQTHYPRERDLGIEILKQESGLDLGGEYPVQIPYFMMELIEEITSQARLSKYVDQASGVSARFSLANYRTMVASARHRAVILKEPLAVPRISDLGHLGASSLGKLELDLMGSHQMTERKVLEALIANAIKVVFESYVGEFGLGQIAEIFNKGVRIEVGDLLPSSVYAERLKHVPPVWEAAFDVNATDQPAIRAACVEFVLAGLYSLDKISRASKHGKVSYEV